MSISLKKYLNQFSKEELIEQISELHNTYKDVKKYYAFAKDPDLEKKLELIKSQVYKSIFSTKKLKISKSNKIISDFMKLKPTPDIIVDLNLFYINSLFEQYKYGYGFTHTTIEFIEKSFKKTCDIIDKNGLFKEMNAALLRTIEIANTYYIYGNNNLKTSYQMLFEKK